MNTTLYYIHDPMCSWCWGYRPVWQQIQENLPAEVNVEYLLGGLAPDTDQPMPEDMQHAIQGYWEKIHTLLGTEFNFDFWTLNTPRRSTYIACRAVIAAKNQGLEYEMIEAIQRAYYLKAMNPSDSDILLQIAWDLYAQELPMDLDQFSNELNHPATQQTLNEQMALIATLPASGFPSLVLKSGDKLDAITRDYSNPQPAIDDISQLINR